MNIFKPHGMKGSNGISPFCATDFLFRLGSILSETVKGEKANWGYQFHYWLKRKNITFHMDPIDGSRLHIYSHTALKIYAHIAHVEEFLLTREESWTKKFLLEACQNSRMNSELRVLALFSFVVGEPFTAYHNLLVVRDTK